MTFRRIAPWLIFGPITGFLAEGIYRNLRARNPVLASLYGVAAVFSAFDLMIYGTGALLTLNRWIS